MSDRRIEVYNGEQVVTVFTLPDGCDHVEVWWDSDNHVRLGWEE